MNKLFAFSSPLLVLFFFSNSFSGALNVYGSGYSYYGVENSSHYSSVSCSVAKLDDAIRLSLSGSHGVVESREISIPADKAVSYISSNSFTSYSCAGEKGGAYGANSCSGDGVSGLGCTARSNSYAYKYGCSFFHSCSIVYALDDIVSLPTCSDFLPLADERCDGGHGLWLIGTETELDAVSALIGNQYGIRTPVSTKSGSVTRPDGSECDLGSYSVAILQAVYCPLGLVEKPDGSSSSSEDEVIDCYNSEMEAFSNMQVENLKCIEAGGLSNLYVDSGNCLRGGCNMPEKSSSSLGVVESSSSSEELFSSSSVEMVSSSSSNSIGQCLASKPLLQKPAGYYDDWVYLGKETYGSRHVSRSSIKPGARLFDILGRTYGKVKARIKYYIFNDDIERNEFDVLLQFDVYGRIIKDSEGNDIQVFTKEDSKNGLRRDSSFYYDGYWEVFEFGEKETRFWTSSGIMSLRKYDDKKRLKERYMTNEKGDTLSSEGYEWKNGRLIKTLINGVERVYIYGNTLQDTVKVVPSDEGVNYHSGYDGTAGKIPEEGTREYEIFAMTPYGHVHFGNEEEDELEYYYAPKESSNSLNILAKSVTRGCVNERDGMPRAQCIRYEEKDVPKTTRDRLFGFPRIHNDSTDNIYGYSKFELSLNYNCLCNEYGEYQLSFSGNTINEKIEIYLSIWEYNYGGQNWHETCWDDDYLQGSYAHETQHIRNGRYKAITLSSYVLQRFFDTKEECEKKGKEEEEYLKIRWNQWHNMEKAHKNSNSPERYGNNRREKPCN